MTYKPRYLKIDPEREKKLDEVVKRLLQKRRETKNSKPPETTLDNKLSEITIEERLEKLELELAEAKQTINRMIEEKDAKEDGKKVIRANAFVVEDDQGNERVMLLGGGWGTGLFLLDEKGNIRASLSDLGLWLHDEKGNRRAILVVDKDIGPGLWLYDEKGNQRARLGVYNDLGPCLWLYDEKGKLRISLGEDNDGSGLGLCMYDEKESSRASLYESGLVLLDEKENLRVDLNLDNNGPSLWFGDDEENEVCRVP